MLDRKLVCVGLDLKYWDDVKESLESALKLDAGRMTLTDIKDAVEDQQMQLWGLHDGILRAVMVTELINYPQMRVVRIVAVGGRDMDMWLDTLIKTIEQWGAENGAHAMEFVGRMGWQKALSKKGWINPQIMMTRMIYG
jgi:hypothetical protein